MKGNGKLVVDVRGAAKHFGEGAERIHPDKRSAIDGPGIPSYRGLGPRPFLC